MSTIVDQFGKPIKQEKLKQEIATPTVSGVRNTWMNESVAGSLNPSRLASLLQSANEGEDLDYLTLAEEMEEREWHYGSVLGTRKRAIEGLDIQVSAGIEGDKKSEEIAEAVRKQLMRPVFEDLVSGLLDALGKGRSTIEIMWSTGTSWQPDKFVWRDPRFFQWHSEDSSQLRLRDESDETNGVELAAYKFITHTPRLKMGIVARNGLARLAAAAYMLKSFTVKDWMAFSELFGMPIRVGRYGPSASEPDKDVLRRALMNLGSDAAAMIPESMQLEFIERSNSQSGHNVFKELAEFLDKGISKAVLGQTGTTEGQAGKLGGLQEMEDVRDDIKRADAKQLARTINEQFIRPFVDLNFGVQEDYPRLSFVIPEPDDTEQWTNALAKLVPLGLKVKQGVVRDKLGIDDPEDDEDLLGQTPTTNSEIKEVSANNHEVALNQYQDAISEIAESALGDWEPIMNPVIDPIQQLVSECNSEEELKQRLPALIRSINTEQLIEHLTAQTLQARGVGYGAN